MSESVAIAARIVLFDILLFFDSKRHDGNQCEYYTNLVIFGFRRIFHLFLSDTKGALKTRIPIHIMRIARESP